MPSGIRSHPKTRAIIAKKIAETAFWRSVVSCTPRLSTKMLEVATPAIAMEAMAPLPNGQTYKGSLPGNGIHLPVEAIHSAVRMRNHAKGAERHRRVAR